MSRLPGNDTGFRAALWGLAGAYALLIAAMLVAGAWRAKPSDLWSAFATPEIRYAALLSLLTATLSAILSIVVAIPAGYLLARSKNVKWVGWLFEIPIVLPPLVLGLGLLILFQTPPGRAIERGVQWFFASLGITAIRGVTFEIPAIVLAQFTAAAAFAVRVMRSTFEQVDEEPEQVALTLGASRGQAFWHIALPTAWPGVVGAFTLAFSRSLGEFGPVLVFAGATRMKTEVLPTSVFLELNIGNLQGAIAASALLIAIAMIVLLLGRVASRASE